MKTYRIMNKKTKEWWQGEAKSVHEACKASGWMIENCYIREYSTTGSGGWKNPGEMKHNKKGEGMTKRGGNANHPVEGSEIKVEPIRDVKDIKAIRKMLNGNAMYQALFTMGINTNLRASDLVRITAGRVRDVRALGEIELREKKTGKVRRISLNKTCVEAIQELLATGTWRDEDPLFKGQRGPLTVPSVHRLVKGWCRAIHLKGNYGSHTLRKTWGYHQRVSFGAGMPELMTCFNHSTQSQTLAYLCVQPEEIRNIYANEL